MPKRSASKRKKKQAPARKVAKQAAKKTVRAASRRAARSTSAKRTNASRGRKKTGPRAGRGQRARGVEAVPSRYGSATPVLIVSPCREALDYYQRAFGAEELGAVDGPGGLVMHAEMKIGDSIIMLSDEQPEMQGGAVKRQTPKNAGASSGGVMLYVEDVDAFVERAVAEGGRLEMPPTDTFWGDRFATVEDPFGHLWSVATHVRDVSMDEMREAMAQMSAPQP